MDREAGAQTRRPVLDRLGDERQLATGRLDLVEHVGVHVALTMKLAQHDLVACLVVAEEAPLVAEEEAVVAEEEPVVLEEEEPPVKEPQE